MNAIVASRLTKRYGGLTAVDEVSFEIPAGQLVAMLGPNAAGKTTTVEILEGFLAPTSGSVRVLGTDPRRGGRSWRSRIGLVMQSTSLDGELTVRELLAAFGRLYPDPLPVREVLSIIDLTGEADTRAAALSGGQQRRVDIGAGIIGRPEVLFLDEPTTGLDPEARRRVWQGIGQLAEAGMTLLLTTHYIEEASQFADRVMVISSGRIIADGAPAELRSRAGGTTIRFPLPRHFPPASLPAWLIDAFDAERLALAVRTDDVNAALPALIAWARGHGLGLDGIEVGPPSLEDAYLAITTEQPVKEACHV